MRRELLLGCGSRREKILWAGPPEWEGLVTLDGNGDHKPDVIWDLERPEPLPFEAGTFDEVHAYEVLEHIGQQGDFLTFFRQFSDYWRILKPEGILFATVPSGALWTWGDPSHKRVINSGTLVFLSQLEYQKQIGKTPMSDFRFCYKADFDTIFSQEQQDSFWFGLKTVKPSRWKPANA
jgi:hypothetical protein